MAPKHCLHCATAFPETLDIHFCPRCGKPAGSQPPAGAPAASPATALAVETEVRELLKAGNFLQAIRVHRQATGSSLKDARDRIVELIRKHNIPPPPLPPLAVRLRNRAIASAVLGSIAAAILVKVLPNMVGLGVLLVCQYAQLLCPAGRFTWEPYALTFATCFVGFFILISILRARAGDVPPLWRDAM